MQSRYQALRMVTITCRKARQYAIYIWTCAGDACTSNRRATMHPLCNVEYCVKFQMSRGEHAYYHTHTHAHTYTITPKILVYVQFLRQTNSSCICCKCNCHSWQRQPTLTAEMFDACRSAAKCEKGVDTCIHISKKKKKITKKERRKQH